MIDRIVIIGVPQSGKTTYAKKRYEADIVIHTDNLLTCDEMKWSERSERIVYWMTSRKRFCIEGCDAVRGLRKFMKENPDAQPADRVIWLGRPQAPVSKQQAAFGKGCRKIFDEILPELHRRGVEVVFDE